VGVFDEYIYKAVFIISTNRRGIMKEENKSSREEFKRLAKEIVKLAVKALESESKVLYEEAELC
jgi:Ribonuclease G/E